MKTKTKAKSKTKIKIKSKTKSSPKKQKAELLKIKSIRKRSGEVVPFDLDVIVQAILKAFTVSAEGGEKEAKEVAQSVFKSLVKVRDEILSKNKKAVFLPTVEMVQDLVEKELMSNNFPETAKKYILYRSRRSELRKAFGPVPEATKKLMDDSSKYFSSPYSEFIFYRSYSRWNDAEGRRETWVEAVDRYFSFMKENLSDKLKESEYQEIKNAVLNMQIVPSMRLMWGAGSAARKSNAVAYNCSFIAPTTPRDISEIMFLSMSGCGVGYSVESETAQQFPIVKRQIGQKLKTFVVDDSREGWCEALTHGLETWWNGRDVEFDFSKVRPQGARLSTMGGRASGPAPLVELLAFSKAKILRRQGKRLTNLDIHDIICKVGEMVVAGGVRRTALISLSDLDDEQIRHAKDGQFYVNEPQRSLANNSAVYLQKPTATEFLEEWLALAKSGSGERGIFNRGSMIHQMPKRRWDIMSEEDRRTIGTNPCGEITLRSKQFCNLTEIVARADDTEETLLLKTRYATILGTYQSMLTNFKYLSPEWKKNCEEDRLLGVSVTGEWDCDAFRNPSTMHKMKEQALKVNQEFAKRFNINKSASVTCVKPSGTVSQLVDAASGMHPRHAQYYIRRVRISATDPLFHLMKDQGVPYHPEVGQDVSTANTFVFEFPIKAPDSAKIFKESLSAIEQLEYWKMVKVNFTEHNPSVTISIGEDEWIEAGNWVYKNWDIIGGLSFLPRSNHVYQLAPYEVINKQQYEELKSRIKDIDFSKIIFYEQDDKTEGAKELACVGGVCEIV